MATTTNPVAGVQMIALSEIRHDQNVRQQILAEEVDALAQSIALLGQLTPVSVRPDESGGFVLIAGHKRYAALAQLGHTEIRAEIRPDGESEASERAAENIVRSSLNPYEPSGIALDASFGRSGDAGAQCSWAIPGFAAGLLATGNTAGRGRFSASHPDQMQHCCSDCDRRWVAALTLLARRTWCSRRVSRSWTQPKRCSTGCLRGGLRSSRVGC